MARHRKLTQKFAGFPMFKLGTSGDTYPFTSPFTSEFVGLDGLSLDLQFATDKTLTARKGPTPVFTRGSSATQVGSTGLIEYAPENLILYSNSVSNIAWTKEGGSTSQSTETINGLTAELYSENSANATHRFYRTHDVFVGQKSTFSLWLKDSGRRYVCINIGAIGPASTSKLVVDLVNQVFVVTAAGVTTDIQIEPNGWARYSFTFEPRAAAGSIPIQSNFSSTVVSESGVGSGGPAFLVAGQQLERFSSARAYIPTTTAAIYGPRFDHDPVTLACKGLLIEESRTNSLSFSEAISNTAWSGFATATAVDNQSKSPSGVVLSASRLTANSGTSTVRMRLRVLTIVTGGTAYSASAFIKAGSSNFGVVSLTFNKSGTGGIRNCDANIVFSTGIVTQTGVSNANFTVTSTPYPDGWYRITVSATSNASTNAEDQVVIGVGLSFNGIGGSGTFAGTETVFAWGAQLEAGSFATSYIPTTTASLTRSADVCSITGSAFTNLWNTTGGTFLFEGFLTNYGGINHRMLSSGAARRWLYGNQAGIGTIAETLTAYDGVSTPNYFTNIRIATKFKIAISVEALTCKASFNGSAISTVSHNGNLLTSVTLLGLFESASGYIASVKYYKKNLSNAKLQALTV